MPGASFRETAYFTKKGSYSRDTVVYFYPLDISGSSPDNRDHNRSVSVIIYLTGSSHTDMRVNLFVT